MKKQIPNIFTLLNLVFGCMAIIAVMQNGLAIQYTPDGGQFIEIPGEIWMASLFIALAAVVDFYDGFLARLLGASSAMGKQLDSLADVVSFGVAPSMIVYQFLRMSFAEGEDGIYTSSIFLVPAFVIAAAGAYRLARYNISENTFAGFTGVPIPAVGILIASLPLIYWNVGNAIVINILLSKWFLYGLIIIVSWLMVSTIPMMDMKFKGISFTENKARYILIIISVIALLLLQWLAIPLAFITYIILSLIFQKK